MQKPKVIFLLGSAASGKTTISQELFPSKMPILNVDDEYVQLLNQANIGTDIAEFDHDKLSKAASCLAKAKSNMSAKTQQYFEQGKTFIYDGTGGAYKPMSKMVETARSFGYDIFCIFCWATPYTCVARNYNRERRLKNSIVIRNWRDVNINYTKYRELFGKNFYTINNDPNRYSYDLYPNYDIENILIEFPFKSSGKVYTPEEINKKEIENNQIKNDIEMLRQQFSWKYDRLTDVKTALKDFVLELK